MRRAAFLLAALGLAACSGGGEGGASSTAEFDPRSDPRITPLLGGCAKNDFYDRNVADIVPILVEKLATGGRDPLKRAKEELASIGDDAIPELRRFIERHYTESHGVAYLQNAVDVLMRTESEEAREILLRCLEHPGDAIRLAAIQGLKLRHARPEDFDRLVSHLDVEINEQKHQVALSLHAADPARAEELYLGWIRDGVRTGLHRYVAPVLARSTRPETAAACAVLFEGASLDVATHVAAPAAAAGDEAALAFFRAELALDDANAGHLQRRTNAASAAGTAGLIPLLAEVLADDTNPSVRGVAAQGLAGDAEDELTDEARAALRLGLDDLSPVVRGGCLTLLVERGDEVAIDRALAQLTGGTAALQEAMSALLRRLSVDPALTERTLTRLLERDELESFLPLADRAATLKSVGQIPSGEAVRFLRGLAAGHADEIVERLRAHEWLMIQASNTGDAGRVVLLEELAGETDPARRLDLLWAVSASRSDFTRDSLLALLESGDLAEVETLFVADRLARLGPASEMAGRLKRAVNRVESGELRLVLQCLLWRWY
ncbi:MAG: hypothetical protein AAF682_23955 [Planctomycetota bacterium]